MGSLVDNGYYRLLSLLFALAIGLPLLIMAWQGGGRVSVVEKRVLAAAPERPVDLATLTAWPDAFEQYYADNFGWRPQLIDGYRGLKRRLGDSPSEDVTIGKDGWLFLGSARRGYTKYRDPIGDARHINRYDEATLVEAARRLSAQARWLAQRGIGYLFVVAPNKHSIYFDKMPDYVTRVAEQSALDQLLAYLDTHTEVQTVDLRPALMGARREGAPLYFRYDSHWNHRGANVAQQVMFTKLETMYPGQFRPTRFPMRETTAQAKDLGIKAGWGDAIEPDYLPQFSDDWCEPRRAPATEQRLRETHSYYCDGAQLEALIFRDSFFTQLQPYVSRQFARSTYVWQRLGVLTLNNEVARAKPDLVIEQVVERALPFVPQLNMARLEAEIAAFKQ